MTSLNLSRNTDLDELFRAVRNQLCVGVSDKNRIVIAGGFAANRQLGRDIDVFILDCQLRSDRLNGLYESGISMGFIDTTRPGHPIVFDAWSPEDEREYINGAWDHKLWRTFPKAWHGRNLQVILSSHKTLPDLLDSFDITTHMVGLEWDEVLGVNTVRGRRYTPPNVPPRVVRFNHPGKSLERLQKIAARYGTPAEPDHVRELKILAESLAVLEGLGTENEVAAASW